ncbi:MAG: O-acetylhomoserine aminocarboxypropyltransferase [Epulopiscium sp. Nele67-Bin004]|nr:MAG: O-acetylhomoserine aminocarboxypropyltransferase [Epulopiscium sp. Nele67-Bin004]
MKDMKLDTQCIQAGYTPENGAPRIAPLIQSTTYKYENTFEVEKLFNLEATGHTYSRISNPTCSVLEEKIATLEGGVGAIAVSSGQSAIMLAVLNVAKAGDHILSMANLYGGTTVLFNTILVDLGLEFTYIPPETPLDEMKTYIKPNTKAVFGETIGNPGLGVLDFEKVSTLAHDAGIPLIIDNTFATPYLCRPFEHGADIVVHSTTKYLDGHATCVGGIVVDSGKFDWTNGNFPRFTEPDPGYHNLVYTDTYGEKAYTGKARATLLRNIGCSMSPFNAWLTNLGTETLAVRMDKHCANALALAKYLEAHPKIEWVLYPLLESNDSYELAQKYLPDGASGIVAFGVKGDATNAQKLINSVELATLVVHVGDLRTHMLHPASMTHSQLTPEEQLLAGVTPDLIRLSIGIEHIDDIIRDIEQALEKI